jgi:hypothetical protein
MGRQRAVTQGRGLKMSRVILLLLLVGLGLAVALLVISVFSGGRTSADGTLTRGGASGVQKTAYALLLAVLFGIGSGLLSEL